MKKNANMDSLNGASCGLSQQKRKRAALFPRIWQILKPPLEISPWGERRYEEPMAAAKALSWHCSKKDWKTGLFLLPAHSELYFTELDTKEASSRQAVARILKLLESGYLEKDCDVALLDEWDANLDEKARTAQDRLIDDLAQSKCIIEVLHNSR